MEYEYKEITIKELVDLVKSLIKEFFKKWYIILISAFTLCLIMYISEKNKKVIFLGSIKFTLNGSGNSSLGGLLGQFGLGSSGDVNLAKAVELSTSKLLLYKTLFYKVEINNQYDYIANHIYRIYNYNSIFEDIEDSEVKKKYMAFKGFTNSNFNTFDTVSSEILNMIYNQIVKEGGLLVSSYDIDKSIAKIEVISENQQLSYHLIIKLYEELENYYNYNNKYLLESNYNILKNKEDSIYNLMKNAEMQYAQFNDENKNLIFEQDEIKRTMLQKDIVKYTSMYSEIAKQLEISDITRKSLSANIDLIDKPYFPLLKIKPNILRASLIGIFFGTILGIIFVMIILFYKKYF